MIEEFKNWFSDIAFLRKAFSWARRVISKLPRSTSSPSASANYDLHFYGPTTVSFSDKGIEKIKTDDIASERENADTQNNSKHGGEENAVMHDVEAAERGDARAQFNLGFMYYKGRGIDTDEVKAFGWTRKAAVQGFAPAQYLLGGAYYNGMGTKRDDVEGFFLAS